MWRTMSTQCIPLHETQRKHWNADCWGKCGNNFLVHNLLFIFSKQLPLSIYGITYVMLVLERNKMCVNRWIGILSSTLKSLESTERVSHVGSMMMIGTVHYIELVKKTHSIKDLDWTLYWPLDLIKAFNSLFWFELINFNYWMFWLKLRVSQYYMLLVIS